MKARNLRKKNTLGDLLNLRTIKEELQKKELSYLKPQGKMFYQA